MGTEVLQSHECARHRLTPDADTFRSSPHSKPCRRAFPNPARNARRKRRCKENADPGPMVVKIPSANLVMEKVKILKRGEELKPSSPPKDLRSEAECDSAVKDSRTSIRSSVPKINDDDSAFSSSDPNAVLKQIQLTDSESDNEVYAGPAFFSSPSPSSLPIPGFLSKKRFSSQKQLQRTRDERSSPTVAP